MHEGGFFYFLLLMMDSISLVTPVTLSNFDEEAYLAINPDVREALRKRHHKSGRAHYEKYGIHEKRYQWNGEIPRAWKEEKFKFIENSIQTAVSCRQRDHFYDFVEPDLQEVDHASRLEGIRISDWEYDHKARKLLKEFPHGWILDCGAGWRKRYYRYVINLEILPFPSTDVLASGEALPFRDNTFDAVLSSSVLEHVRDPFQCASELARVLKPGGALFCSVPFLQPFHGYPGHYYNMTSEGVKNLFQDTLEIEEQSVYGSLRPISSLCWILRSWAEGLGGKTREDFLNMKVSDFLAGRDQYMEAPFVRELSPRKNFELASATVLIARKSKPEESRDPSLNRP